ncbi:MAG: hypothetical protein LLG13_18075 [Bacteroidales bacterium]|nr:hypothetical protein [Bacteroidales bacterium]
MHFKKTFYYRFGLSGNDSESGMMMDQEDNDDDFLGYLYCKYNLHPSNPKHIRNLNEATDFLEFQLRSWEGDVSEWLQHTLQIVNSSYNKLKTDKKFLKSDFSEIDAVIEWLKTKRQKEIELSDSENNISLIEEKNIQDPDATGNKHLLNIPTRATPEQILSFWLKLQGNNEKGEPYWESEQEIEHFVYQNFDVFPGVDEIKVFNPNMNKSELNHATWTFYHEYGMSKTKKLYEKLLILNFTIFKDDKNAYSNTKDQSVEHLKKLFE